ncbi:MAG: IS1096 element passenger TnpR family protein [Paludibacter sp.]
MIYKFTVLSDEVDNFVRVIKIDPEATFFDLHNTILDSVKYDKNQMTSFFICSDEWEKEQEVTLIEMDSSSEYDNLVMDKTKLEELLEDEKQKLLYVFDMISDRAFFIELTEIIPGKSVAKPEVVSTEGKAPQQIMAEEAITAAPKLNLDENFYGDEDFNIDELDEEGFGDMNFDDSTLFADDSTL